MIGLRLDSKPDKWDQTKSSHRGSQATLVKVNTLGLLGIVYSILFGKIFGEGAWTT